MPGYSGLVAGGSYEPPRHGKTPFTYGGNVRTHVASEVSLGGLELEAGNAGRRAEDSRLARLAAAVPDISMST
jgi:hypothetical protein